MNCILLIINIILIYKNSILLTNKIVFLFCHLYGGYKTSVFKRYIIDY